MGPITNEDNEALIQTAILRLEDKVVMLKTRHTPDAHKKAFKANGELCTILKKDGTVAKVWTVLLDDQYLVPVDKLEPMRGDAMLIGNRAGRISKATPVLNGTEVQFYQLKVVMAKLEDEDED